MSAIRCTAVSKAFDPVEAVSGVDLDVEEGTIFALLGPSGCGKTTMLRLLAGFERPDAGTIEVAGRPLAGPSVFVPPERRRIGMVFQDYALFPHFDVAGNVAYGLRNGSARRVAEVLELVGLGGLEARLPHELSGGEQQRVALARALASGPDVILLDEPFSNLDAALRARVRAEIREILREAGVTTVFVTHDQEEALSLAETVAVMRDGRIVQSGTPEEIYGRPASRWIAEFLGEAEILPASAGEGWVECELARVPVRTDLPGPVQMVVRPESIAITSGVTPGGHLASEGEVVQREFYGHDQLVHVRLESGTVLRSRCLGYPAWHPGDRVRVWVEGPVTVIPAEDADQVSAPDESASTAP